MADVTTTPQVLDSNTCILYGNYYRLASPVSVSLSGQYPPKRVTGDFDTTSDPLISIVDFHDCVDGLGTYRMRSKADAKKFWTSTCMTWKDNIITLPPLATTIANPSGVTAAVSSVIHGHDDNIYVSFGADIYRLQSALTYSALLKSLTVSPTGRPIVFNARTFWPRGSGGYTYYDGTTFTDVSGQEALHFTVWDGRIFLVESTTSTIKHSVTGSSGSWTSLSTAIDIPVGIINGLTVYDDANGDPVVHVLTEHGPYIVDFTNAKVLRTRVQLPRNSQAGTGSRAWRDSLYFTSRIAVYRMTSSRDAMFVEPVGLDRRDGVPSDQNGNIIEVIPSLSYVYFACDATTTANNAITQGPAGGRALGFDGFGAITTTARSTGFSTIYLHDGRSNHIFFQSGSTAQAITTSEVSDAYSAYRLYFGADRTLYYINLPQGLDNPLQDTTLTYASTATHITSWFADDNMHEGKTGLRIILECEGMSANETVVVSYGTNQGTGWTTLGTISSDGRTSLRLGTNNEGVSFRSIRFRFVLSRGSTNTNRPVITHACLQYLRNPRGVRGFVADLDLSGFGPNGESPAEQVDNVWTALTTDTLGTFSYRDDVGNTRSYLVKVVGPEGVEFTGPVEGGRYKLVLAQFNNS